MPSIDLDLPESLSCLCPYPYLVHARRRPRALCTRSTAHMMGKASTQRSDIFITRYGKINLCVSGKGGVAGERAVAARAASASRADCTCYRSSWPAWSLIRHPGLALLLDPCVLPSAPGRCLFFWIHLFLHLQHRWAASSPEQRSGGRGMGAGIYCAAALRDSAP